MEWLSKLSRAKIDWLYNYLVSTGGLVGSVGIVKPKDRRTLVENLLKSLQQRTVLEYEVKEKELFGAMGREALEDEDLNWLDPKNRLQCLLVWGAVKSLYLINSVGLEVNELAEVQDAQRPTQYIFSPENFKFSGVFKNIMGEGQGSDSTEIVTHVSDFFQRLRGPRLFKTNLLSFLKGRANNLAHKGSPVYGISNTDGETRRWAWEYLLNKGVPVSYLSANEFEIEREHLIVAFDLWDASEAEKELLLHRLKAAFSQRKTRMKRQSRKAYQIYLTPGHKDMLSQLAWEYDRKIYEVVEHLISDAFKELKKK